MGCTPSVNQPAKHGEQPARPRGGSNAGSGQCVQNAPSNNSALQENGTAEDSEADAKQEILQARMQHFNYPRLREIKGADDKKTYLLAVFGDLDNPTTGLTIATRAENGTIHAVEWTDTTISQQKPRRLNVSSFWKTLASCMTKGGDVKLTKEGSRVEFSHRRTNSERTVAELSKLGTDWQFTFEFIVLPFVFFYKKKSTELEGEEKARLLKKECLLNTFEASNFTFDINFKAIDKTLAPLRERAREARDRISNHDSRVRQLENLLAQVKEGGTTKLDKVYAVPQPEDAEEPKVLPMEEWGKWDFNAYNINESMVHVAWTLFDHYDLIDHFNINATQFKNFWRQVEKQCRDNPYHNASRCNEVMITMHCIISTLGLGRYKNAGKVALTPEDVLASIIAGGIIDLDHPGLDNNCLIQSKDFQATFYSDLFIIEQNRLTVMFEMLESEHLNILAPLDTEQRKEVRDTLVEILYMKANAKMQSMEEKLAEFKEKINVSDWSKKDDVRLALTMALRVADVSVWARELNIHQAGLEKVAEEFYNQGDIEMAHGFIASPFMDSCWTADRLKHVKDFPKGQIQIIDTIVVPLLEAMQQVAPEFLSVLELANANKKYWAQIEETASGQQAKSVVSLQLAEIPKHFSVTPDRKAAAVALPHSDVSSMLLCVSTKSDVYFATLGEELLSSFEPGDLDKIVDLVISDLAKPNKALASDERLAIDLGDKVIEAQKGNTDHETFLLRCASSFLRQRSRDKADAELDDALKTALKLKPILSTMEDEIRACKKCVGSAKEKESKQLKEIASLEAELRQLGQEVPNDEIVACVRNPLAAPMPVGTSTVPDCRDIDHEVFCIVKSQWDPWEEGEEYAPEKHLFANVIKPYTKSEFAQVTEGLDDGKRRTIWKLLESIDEWDFDVFSLQAQMSGSYTHEGLANQPNGGSLFMTCYALFYKYGFMRKFNINEKIVINWLSMIEAGYHPNPYHNSMHAADVLHVSHYILKRGDLIDKCKVSDENIFCTLFAAAIHDYNHPGINNAFHVKTQNYLAVLWNDRSVNENVHVSSVFELMRLDRFNILAPFEHEHQAEMRKMIVELVLGTDMGLHAQILSRFKKRLEGKNPREDIELALTMAVKMADISNCGRPRKLYHGWCNQIADEFFMQGDRERLMGLAVSPFMDRYTTVMSKGQTAFMNYIVVPLFECMAEFLPKMQHATDLIEQNKYFWQEHEDW